MRRAVFVEPSFESADNPQRMQMRRGTAVTDMYARRRRVQQIGEGPIRRSRGEPWRRTRREEDQAEQHGPGEPHASISSRTRGSAMASRKSPSNVPNARKPAPAAAHADTR